MDKSVCFINKCECIVQKSVIDLYTVDEGLNHVFLDMKGLKKHRNTVAFWAVGDESPNIKSILQSIKHEERLKRGIRLIEDELALIEAS